MPKKRPDAVVENFSLYNGEVQISFNPSSHRSKVSDLGCKPFYAPSTTTILGVLNKPALVAWSANTVANSIRDQFQKLLEDNSFSVEQLLQIIEDGRRAPESVKQDAADIGTEAHDWLKDYWRRHIQKLDKPETPEDGPVRNCITGALGWFAEHRVVPIRIECPVYSRKHKITGRPDFVGLVDDRMAVIDYKSTKYLYPEVALQTVSYAGMDEEEYGVPILDRWGLRMDKTTGEFEDRKYPESTREEDMDTFLSTFKIYDRLKYLRRKEKPEVGEGKADEVHKNDWLEELAGKA